MLECACQGKWANADKCGFDFAAGGLTGCGKTTILNRMHKEGYQVLDLEVHITFTTITSTTTITSSTTITSTTTITTETTLALLATRVSLHYVNHRRVRAWPIIEARY